ncbi:MAG: hypothetical protein MPK10_07335 [Gammaproteobacteria bacterium]|nr:hypothetical protein [Gammaproteobacteria bacterium]MDA7995235.1 hypothetical protein [Gammaproteobacteria bacterium]CAJ2377598.1 MAG: hypothetical protein IBGAMO2_860010 [Arenicellales bacterium IbO2]
MRRYWLVEETVFEVSDKEVVAKDKTGPNAATIRDDMNERDRIAIKRSDTRGVTIQHVGMLKGAVVRSGFPGYKVKWVRTNLDREIPSPDLAKKEVMAFEQKQDGEGWKKNGKKLGEALYKAFCM